MDFETQLPEWKNEGAEPSEDLQTNGFKEGYKPPASIFNFWWAKVSKAIKEIHSKLSNVDNTADIDKPVSTAQATAIADAKKAGTSAQANLTAHINTKTNPHGVTAAQVGLDKVNNTPDSEKNVAFASEAGIGRKLKYALSVRFNGGRTEGTDLWTFDGETSKSINITPDKIKAANADEVIKIVDAVTEDGTTYTVTAPDITELKNGMELTIIPSANNISLSPRLAVNELGDKAIRLAHSFNCAATNALKTNFMQAGRPIKLKYDANCNLGTQGNGAWIFADRQKTSAQDLYGTVPIESGGTDANTAEQARTNLGIAKMLREPALTDGITNVEVTGISEYSVLSGIFSFEPNAAEYEIVSGSIMLLRLGNGFTGSSGSIVAKGATAPYTYEKPVTVFVELATTGDQITKATIKARLEGDTTVYSARIGNLYGIS